MCTYVQYRCLTSPQILIVAHMNGLYLNTPECKNWRIFTTPKPCTHSTKPRIPNPQVTTMVRNIKTGFKKHLLSVTTFKRLSHLSTRNKIYKFCKTCKPNPISIHHIHFCWLLPCSCCSQWAEMRVSCCFKHGPGVCISQALPNLPAALAALTFS